VNESSIPSRSLLSNSFRQVAFIGLQIAGSTYEVRTIMKLSVI